MPATHFSPSQVWYWTDCPDLPESQKLMRDLNGRPYPDDYAITQSRWNSIKAENTGLFHVEIDDMGNEHPDFLGFNLIIVPDPKTGIPIRALRGTY